MGDDDDVVQAQGALDGKNLLDCFLFTPSIMR